MSTAGRSDGGGRRTPAVARIRRRASVRIIAAVAVAAVALPAGPAPAAPPAEPPEGAGGVAAAGTLATRMAETRRHLALDAPARRLFEIGEPAGEGGMAADAYDLDTLEPLARIPIPGAASAEGGRLSAVDPLRHRLFVLSPAGVGVPGDAIRLGSARTGFAVTVIDTVHLQVIGHRALPELAAVPLDPQGPSSTGIGVRAMGFAATGGEGTLLLVTEVPAGVGDLSVGTHSVAVHEVDVGRLLDGGGTTAVNWSAPIPGCGAVMSRETPGVVFHSRSESAVFVPCRQGGMPGLFAQPLATPGVARLRVSDGPAGPTFATDFFPASGNLLWGLAAVDPSSERIFLHADASVTESIVHVFDTRSASWVGMIVLPSGYASGRTAGLAADPARGRVYAVSARQAEPAPHVRVVVASSRSRLADQGVVASCCPDASPVRRGVVADPGSGRLFVPEPGGYAILDDRVPIPEPAPDPDPDANTVDHPEGSDTGVSFLAGTHGYGARLRWVGGVGGVERNTNTISQQPPSLEDPTRGRLPPYPSTGTRDLHLGRVFHATLTDAEATARAAGADRDHDATDADLRGVAGYAARWLACVRDPERPPAGCPLGFSLQASGAPGTADAGEELDERRWPYPAAACTDFGAAEDPRDDAAAGAEVACDRDRARVAAAAESDLAALLDAAPAEVLNVAGARSWSSVIRDPEKGAVAEVSAEAWGIRIGETAGVGRIVTRARTWASGRPAASNGVGAGSSFERILEDVWVRDPAGERQVVCTGVCEDPEAAAEALNRALGARGRVELPAPDPERARGTPGGYEALVVRALPERANEQAVNEEADLSRLEVPGMVVTVFADGRVRARAVLSLAGVSAESHYGIYLLARGGPAAAPPMPLRAISDAPLGITADPLSGLPPQAAPPPGPVEVLRRTVEGIAVVFASPRQAARAAGLWAFLAAPLYLLVRRRVVRGEGTA